MEALSRKFISRLVWKITKQTSPLRGFRSRLFFCVLLSHEFSETDLKAWNNCLMDLPCCHIKVTKVLSKLLKILFANVLTSFCEVVSIDSTTYFFQYDIFFNVYLIAFTLKLPMLQSSICMFSHFVCLSLLRNQHINHILIVLNLDVIKSLFAKQTLMDQWQCQLVVMLS